MGRQGSSSPARSPRLRGTRCADEFDAIDPESARIILIEAGPTILPSFPESLRDSARRALRKLGVEVWERARVTNVEREAVTVGGDRLTAHTIIWAAGVEGSSIGASLGVPRRSRRPRDSAGGPLRPRVP